MASVFVRISMPLRDPKLFFLRRDVETLTMISLLLTQLGKGVENLL